MRFLFATLFLFATTLSAQITTTEVWVGRLDARDFSITQLTNVSNHHGYDNQPAFLPDGNSLVYTSQVRDLSETGQGVEAVIVDLRTNAVTLTNVRGFSPTPFEGGLLVLREGDVWRHDLKGGAPIEMTQVDRAGYFTRFDERTWVLFMNDEQRRIGIYDAKTKALETTATGAITAPYRVPGERAVTFVTADDKGVRTLHRLDLESKKVTTLGVIPFKTGGHHVWTPRGSLLMASGNTIHEWKDGRWRDLWHTNHPDLQGISRIALSPDMTRIALVSVPRDETVIRDSRAASNIGFAQRNAAAALAPYARDAKVTTSTGQYLDSRDAIAKALEAQFAERADLVYVRTPERIDVGKDTASEQGTWTGRGLKGRYMAVWRGTTGDSGTRTWVIASELFVALE